MKKKVIKKNIEAARKVEVMPFCNQDITVFIITTGECTYQQCYEALVEQSISCTIELIENVTPMDRAFQQMIDRCTSRFYVQVDADMILYPRALETMLDKLRLSSFISSFDGSTVAAEKIAMLYFPLFDAHLERQIIGVKIYNHDVMKRHPYQSDYSCEVTQIDRLKNNGFHISYQEPILGRHGTEWTGLQVYERYKRLFQKKAIYGAGNANYDWLAPYPRKFLANYLTGKGLLDLWAYNGCVAGLAAITNPKAGERDSSEPDPTHNVINGILQPDYSTAENKVFQPVKPSLGQYIFQEADLEIFDQECAGKKRVCFVTSEFPGLGPFGGIGTSFKLLASVLAEAGNNIYVLFVTWSEDIFNDSIINEYYRNGISIKVLRVKAHSSQNPKLAASSQIKYWLSDRHFDVIHFCEYGGLGFYTLLSKHQGYLFQNSRIIVQAHGSATQLIAYNNDWDVNIEDQLSLEYCERRSVELADVLVSPSRYLMEWFIEQGFKLPKYSFLVKNVPPKSVTPLSIANTAVGVREIVFLGKQVELKGVTLFCDAIDELELDAGYRVTFVGRAARVDYQNSLGYIAQRAVNWSCQVVFMLEVNSSEIIEYCSAAERLIVIPSLIENSPYVVMECLQAGCRFIASDVGGIPELISPSDQSFTLFKSTPSDLARSIANHIALIFTPPKPSYMAGSIKDSWLQLHQISLKPQVPNKSSSAAVGCVSVCITHRNRPHFLMRAIESAIFQKNVIKEIIIIDDGSSSHNKDALKLIKAKLKGEDIKWIETPSVGLSGARNAGVEHASFDHILFLDDDDIAFPTALDEMLRVQSFTQADIVIGAYKAGSASENGILHDSSSKAPTFLGLGASMALAQLRNCFGPSFALVRKACWKAVGGYNASVDGPYEDWEFYLRAVAAGFLVELYSEATFVYAEHEQQMTKRAKHSKGLERILAASASLPLPESIVDWAGRRLKQDAYAKDNIATWRRIDSSPNVDLIKEMNKPSNSLERNLQLLGEYFERCGKSVEFAKPGCGLHVSGGGVHRKVRAEKVANFEGIRIVAVEIAKSDPGKCAEYISLKLPSVPYESELWGFLMHLRTRCFLNVGDKQRALFDIMDSEHVVGKVENTRAMCAYFTETADEKNLIMYKAQLTALEESIYLQSYPDVQRSVIEGSVPSATYHFRYHGKSEGRSWPHSPVWNQVQVVSSQNSVPPPIAAAKSKKK